MWTRAGREFDMIFHLGFLEDGEYEDRSRSATTRSSMRSGTVSSPKEGWDAIFLGNHDLPRLASVVGDEERFWKESVTCLATMILTQWGTPFLYQGR